MQGSILWKSKLFCNLDKGICSVHVNSQDSPWFAVEYAIAAHILTNYRQCTNPKQNTVHLIDNCSKGVYAQNCNADDELGTNVREKIFSLFLNLSNSRVISMIKLKAQIEASST